VAALAGPCVAWHATEAISVRIQADVVLALSRPTFVIDGEGALFQPSFIAGRFSLGVDFRLF
jgi:hypothetical protein